MKYTVNIYEVSTEKDKKLRAFAAVTKEIWRNLKGSLIKNSPMNRS